MYVSSLHLISRRCYIINKHKSVLSYCIPFNATVAIRLLLFSLRPPSNSCCGWLDDLLTRGVWWSSPVESHLIESPSNGNNFKPTSQIIRHFSRRTWFSNKLSSQQTQLIPHHTGNAPGQSWNEGEGGGILSTTLFHVLEHFERRLTRSSESKHSLSLRF